MRNLWLCILFIIIYSSLPAQRLVNLSHLNHLYEEKKIEGKSMGTIWIYCEAPDMKRITDEDEGFTCIDDVARALIVYAGEYSKNPHPSLKHKIEMLTEFILYMADDKGVWYNFMFPEGEINRHHINSKAAPNFWTWRAYWALSEIEKLQLPGWQRRYKAINTLCQKTESVIDTLLLHQNNVKVKHGFPQSHLITFPGGDQLAVMLMALVNRYATHPQKNKKELLVKIADVLAGSVKGDEQQLPFGAIMCWDNYWHGWGSAQQLALLNAYEATQEKAYLNAALVGVRHFYSWLEQQGFPASMQLSNQDGKWEWTQIQQFPQIAYGFSPMIMAGARAYQLTNDPFYATLTIRMASWFFGNNKPGIQMYNPRTGVALDGISNEKDYNKNAGAESTIEALLAIQALESIAEKDHNFRNIIYSLPLTSDGRN